MKIEGNKFYMLRKFFNFPFLILKQIQIKVLEMGGQLEMETLSIQAFIFVIILVIYILTSHFIEVKKIPYLHESTIALFMGLATAAFTQYALGTTIKFPEELFFALILPPIIFSAGYSLRKSLFFQNFGMISFLGIFGTLIGFVCLTTFLIIVNKMFFQILNLTQIMMISSVLCATDTVAAMALIKSSQYPVLNAVLFGQGIINDAIAIIVFRTVKSMKLDEASEISGQIVLTIVFDFVYLFVFSVALGAISGFALSYLFKNLTTFHKSPLKETSLILLNAHFTYLAGQILGLSGILTLFTCAIIMGHYCFLNISEESQKGTGLAFDTISFVAQAFIFAYLGASIISIHTTYIDICMGFAVLFALPFIRALIIFLMPPIYKLLKKQFPMNTKQLKVCWYGGMVRGGISFALCLQIVTTHKNTILTIALVVVILTTLIGSTFLKNFMNWIGLECHQYSISDLQNDKKQIENDNERAYSARKATIELKDEIKEPETDKKMSKKLQKFQEEYIQPIFLKKKNGSGSSEKKYDGDQISNAEKI